MRVDQLVALTGLLSREAAARADAGDTRDKTEIADDVLREIAAPDIGDALSRLSLMSAWRNGKAGDPPSRVLP